MKKLIAFLMIALIYPATAQTVVSTGNSRKVFAAAPCNPPTMTSRWAPYDSSSLCTGSVACTNGAQIIKLKDLVGTDDATSASAGPTYVTGSINGLPSASFPSGLAQLPLSAGAIPSSGTMTLYAVVKPATGALAMLGGAGIRNIEWRMDGLLRQNFLAQGAVSIGTATTSLTTTSFHTIALTYNFSTGALAFFNCSGGTCSPDGTATTSTSWNTNTEILGYATSVNEGFIGNIAEWGYLNSSSTAGIAAWSQCKYGI